MDLMAAHLHHLPLLPPLLLLHAANDTVQAAPHLLSRRGRAAPLAPVPQGR